MKRGYNIFLAREKEREKKKRKAITVFRPWSSPVAAAIKRPVVMMIYPPQVAVARAAPEIHGNRDMSVSRVAILGMREPQDPDV